jgi:hypothetical protein
VGERRGEALGHGNGCVAGVAQADEPADAMLGQPGIQVEAAGVGFDHQVAPGGGSRVEDLVEPFGVEAGDRSFADGGDEEFPHHIEHPGRGAGMQADGGDERGGRREVGHGWRSPFGGRVAGWRSILGSRDDGNFVGPCPSLASRVTARYTAPPAPAPLEAGV